MTAPPSPADPPPLDDAHYRAMVESALDYAIFSLSLDGIVTSWSAGAERLLGWDPREIVGRHTELVFTPADRRRGVPGQEMRIALEQGRALNERWHLRRDGSRFFGTGLLMPMRQDGRTVGFVKVMRDRTAQLPHPVPIRAGKGDGDDAHDAARVAPDGAEPDAPASGAGERRAKGRLDELLRLKALAEASADIAGAPDLHGTLHAVADAARSLVGAHQAVVSLTRDAAQGQDIHAVSLSARYAPWRSYDTPPDGSGIHSAVTRDNRPMRLTQAELEAHPAWRGFGGHSAEHPPMRGWLAVPLARGDGRNLGLIQLSDRLEGDFDEADQAIVTQLAQFATVAIEQAQVREALTRSEERLRLAIDATRLGTWSLDARSGALEWDERCKALFGLPPDAAIDGYDAFLRALHPDDRERTDAAVRAALDPDGDGRFTMEYRAIGLRDGVERWVSAHGQAFFEGREPVRLLGTALDISARRHAELALRDSEARFRLAARSSSLGHWEVDPRTRRVGWSDNACRMWGFGECATVPLAAALERIHPDDRARVERGIAEAWEPSGHGEFRAQWRVVWPDGSMRWLDALAVTEFAGEGGARRAARFAGIVWDVTETRRLIETLQQADARKDEFLAMLAHELRNPLAPLTNALRLLSRARRAAADADERRMLEVAERQARQLRRLVDDLLEVSRITRGKIVLRPERVRVDEAVRQAADSVAPEIERRGQRLALELPEAPLPISADPARLAQVLENLLNNASKYTPDGGNIRIEVDTARAPAGEDVLIRVIDDGVGIEPARIDEIFDLFTQVDATLDRSQGGLGIGLAMVRRLVEMHGGSVSAASPGRGRGATFTVRLPRSPALDGRPSGVDGARLRT